MKIAVSSDHAGYELKEEIKKILLNLELEVLDLGPNSEESVDYPDYGIAAGEAIANGSANRAIIVCGSGIGISIAANRNPAVRAALCTSGLMARLARQHNDANVLALGARLTGIEVIKDCIHEFLNTPFEGGRHQRRVDKLS
jgi:ribose 5-phosphate isomerase B